MVSRVNIKLLFYDIENNIMIDEDGRPVFDIFKFISPGVLFLFKQNKENMMVMIDVNNYVELIYPDSEFIDDIFMRNCENCYNDN
jgi:hypothetical protein